MRALFSPVILLLGLAVVGVLPAAAEAARRLESPRAAELALGSGIRDSVVHSSPSRLLAASSSWGGTFTTSTGDRVMVRVSDTYPQDPSRPQRWADFLAGLIHGPELATVTLYLAPLAEVQATCGSGALACYNDRTRVMIAPGEDPQADATAEAVVTHEYGHHVAASRDNAPWPAVAYGTKRWASYENVCARSRRGQLFPGAEQDQRYQLNPGEVFAETYRVLNERRQGIPEIPWQVVAATLYPDDTALALVEQDVTQPWAASASSSFAASVGRGRSRSYGVATPYDGTLRASVRATTAPVSVSLVDPGGRRIASTIVAAGSSRSVTTTVCGVRSFRLRVAAARSAAGFRVTLSKP